MAKVRTLSRHFIKNHPKAGQSTFFVEKVLNSLGIDYRSKEYFELLVELNWAKKGINKLTNGDLNYFMNDLHYMQDEKHHTVRSGHHFKKGDLIQLAVWSGKPYASPQIKICPPLEVVKIYYFDLQKDQEGKTWIDIANKYYHRLDMDINQSILPMVARNDGLNTQDFLDWFQAGKKEFDGQVICWKDPEY